MPSAIVASQTPYRCGSLIGAFGYVAFTLLPLALFRLLAPAGENAAISMVVLALVAMPIDFAAIANLLDLLNVLTAEKYQLVAGPRRWLWRRNSAA